MGEIFILNICDSVMRAYLHALGHADGNSLSGREGVGKPYASADDAVISDMGVASEDGCSGVYNDVVADIRVALDALNESAVVVGLKALCAEGNMLVELNVLSDGGGLAYDHAGAVVYKEILAYGSPRMDIYPGLGMGKLRHHSRHDRNTHHIELMGYAVNADSLKGRICKDDLVSADGRRIPLISCLDVSIEIFQHLRKPVHKLIRGLLGGLLVVQDEH